MSSRTAPLLSGLIAVACSGSCVTSEDDHGPAAVELEPAQFAWLSVTARSVGRGFEWTAVPLVCATAAGVLKTGAACLDALPVGAPVTTFQGRSARIAGPGDHPCSFDGRTTPGWKLWIDPVAPPQSARSFSHVGVLDGAGWLPRVARPSTEAELSRLPVPPPASLPSAASTPVVRTVVRTVLTADLLADDGLEVVMERRRAGAGTELWLVSEARVLAIPFGAAPSDSLREVSGALDLGDDGVLLILWSQSAAGGAGKHVVQIRREAGSVDLLSEWWCAAPPPPSRSSLKR